MQIQVLDAIDLVPAERWNELRGTDHPFLRHEFLAALERQGCVAEATGWKPQHLVLRDRAGSLVAAMPLYLKHHSWGEFVFDWSWAEAYRRAGRMYYPKLVAVIPFTPVTGHRCLLAANADAEDSRARLLEAAKALAADLGASSVHVLFPDSTEQAVLRGSGLAFRKDCQFHWFNQDYGSFDEFLETLSSRKRKKIRRERRRVTESDIKLEWSTGSELTDTLWDQIYALYLTTYARRGHSPYLSRDFFGEIGHSMGEDILLSLAWHRGRLIAMAMFFVSRSTLYGRYWGSSGDYHSLHFETCYYQGIERCIRDGLGYFEPGTQGEHKLARGFAPVATWSAHWLADSRIHEAIREYIDTERDHVDRYIEEAARQLPFRRTST